MQRSDCTLAPPGSPSSSWSRELGPGDQRQHRPTPALLRRSLSADPPRLGPQAGPQAPLTPQLTQAAPDPTGSASSCDVGMVVVIMPTGFALPSVPARPPRAHPDAQAGVVPGSSTRHGLRQEESAQDLCGIRGGEQGTALCPEVLGGRPWGRGSRTPSFIGTRRAGLQEMEQGRWAMGVRRRGIQAWQQGCSRGSRAWSQAVQGAWASATFSPESARKGARSSCWITPPGPPACSPLSLLALHLLGQKVSGGAEWAEPSAAVLTTCNPPVVPSASP